MTRGAVFYSPRRQPVVPVFCVEKLTNKQTKTACYGDAGVLDPFVPFGYNGFFHGKIVLQALLFLHELADLLEGLLTQIMLHLTGILRRDLR